MSIKIVISGEQGTGKAILATFLAAHLNDMDVKADIYTTCDEIDTTDLTLEEQV